MGVYFIQTMRKTFFLETADVFGKPLPNRQVAGFLPSLRFSDGDIMHQQKGRKRCIAQDFKGRLGYLQQYDLALDETITLPITVKQADLYAVYLMRANGNVQFMAGQNDHIVSLNKRRALYIYLPAGQYHLHLPAGSYQLFVFYFDVGVFDSGADTDFEFLQPLLEAHRDKTSAPLVSKDFRIGPVTETYIRSLCSRLKKSNLDCQIYIISQLKELIQLSKRKIQLENQSIGEHDHYVEAAKTLIQAGVREKGIRYELPSITSEIPLSRKHFDRIFKRATDCSLERYKKYCAIERSKILLREGLPVWKVSIILGYAEVRSFRRVFKQTVGVTPGSYRQTFI